MRTVENLLVPLAALALAACGQSSTRALDTGVDGMCFEGSYAAGEACTGDWYCSTGAFDGCDDTIASYSCVDGSVVATPVGCGIVPPPDGGADASGDGGDGGDGGSCVDQTIGRLCLRGGVGPMGEVVLSAEAPITFQLYPNGCHSSACTVQEVADCALTRSGSELTLTGRICLGQDGACVTPDCSGGGTAECAETLPDGDYTVTLGELTLSFTVPSTLDLSDACVGEMTL